MIRLLHTMLRVNNLDESLKFYCDKLGIKLLRKQDFPGGEFTLAFVGYGSEAETAVIEFTWNWGTSKYDIGNAYGHVALGVEDAITKIGLLPLAFAAEASAFRVANVSSHLLTNIAIVQRFVDRVIDCDGNEGEPGMIRITTENTEYTEKISG